MLCKIAQIIHAEHANTVTNVPICTSVASSCRPTGTANSKSYSWVVTLNGVKDATAAYRGSNGCWIAGSPNPHVTPALGGGIRMLRCVALYDGCWYRKWIGRSSLNVLRSSLFFRRTMTRLPRGSRTCSKGASRSVSPNTRAFRKSARSWSWLGSTNTLAGNSYTMSSQHSLEGREEKGGGAMTVVIMCGWRLFAFSSVDSMVSSM